MKKRIISLMLAMCMLFSVCGIAEPASDVQEENELVAVEAREVPEGEPETEMELIDEVIEEPAEAAAEVPAAEIAEEPAEAAEEIAAEEPVKDLSGEAAAEPAEEPVKELEAQPRVMYYDPDACSHSRATLTGNRRFEYAWVLTEDNGNGTHTGPGDWMEEYHCNTCNSNFEMFGDSEEAHTEAHVFKGGVCGCGKEQEPCARHTYALVKAKAATCEEDGYRAYYACSVCGAEKTKPVIIPATGHKEKVVPAVAKTCTEPGWSEYTECSVCGTPLSAKEIDTPVGHVREIDPAVEGNCTTMALTEGVHCSVCNEVLKRQFNTGYVHSFVNDVCSLCSEVAPINNLYFTQKEIVLGVKDTYMPSVEVTPVQAAFRLVYTSTDPSVAKVDANGTITALKPGTARIFVYGDDECASMTVYVVAGVSKLTLDKTTLQMEIGGEYTQVLAVEKTGYTANELKWSSSNPSVVDIDSANSSEASLLGKKAGTATIKVQAPNGRSASCKVTVVDPTKLAGVKLATSSTEVFAGDRFYLSAKVMPVSLAWEDVQYSYKSSNPKVVSFEAYADTVEADALAVGTATVTVTATYGTVKKTASVKITVKDPTKLTGLQVGGISAKQTMYLGSEYYAYPLLQPSSDAVIFNTVTSVKVANPAILTAEKDDETYILRPVATGSTRVTITATCGRVTKSFVSTVTIKDPLEPVAVTIRGRDMWEFDPSEPGGLEYAVDIESNAEGMAIGANPYTVSWKSSNPAVATIDSEGYLTVKKAGTVTLTATVKYGKVTKTATKKVTLLDQNVLYAVIPAFTSYEAKVGGLMHIAGMVLPTRIDYSTLSYSITSSNTKLATVDELGRVKLLAPGTVVITFTFTQGKVKKSAKVTIKITK